MTPTIPQGYVLVTKDNADQYSGPSPTSCRHDEWFIPGGKYECSGGFEYARDDKDATGCWFFGEQDYRVIAPIKVSTPTPTPKMKKQFSIAVPTLLISKVIQKALFELGFGWISTGTQEETNSRYYGEKAFINVEGKKMSISSYPDYECITLEQLFAMGEPPKPIKVKLNSEYTAEVSDEIKVGCQMFPISILDDLVAARDKYLAAK